MGSLLRNDVVVSSFGTCEVRNNDILVFPLLTVDRQENIRLEIDKSLGDEPRRASGRITSAAVPQSATLADELVRLLEQHVMKLGTIGVQPDGSITRLAFSDDESAAMAYLRAEGETFGLKGRYDGIGNLILSLPGEFDRRILVGSHVDSVPQGGNYDGAAGCIAALEALRLLHDEAHALNIGIDLVVWRGEEYTFNAVYKGSASAFGMSEPHILHNVYSDVSLRDAIRKQGFDPTYIDQGKPSLGQDYVDSIQGYLELHIEQGSILENENTDIGVVTSIAGDRRFLVVLHGRFDHSGATPMGTVYRSDVNLAMAYMQVRLDELAAQHRQNGHLFVQTVGIVNADPEIDRKYPNVHGNSVTKVSGLGYFTLDIMSSSDSFMDDYAAQVHRVIWKTAREFNVQAFIEQTDMATGVASLDEQCLTALQTACETQNISYKNMPSGAGHDAVVVSQASQSDGNRIPVGMLFIPCRKGISHSKEEYTSPEAIAKGTIVLVEALRSLASAR